jgi:uncharacterized protein (TIGR02145 family)
MNKIFNIVVILLVSLLFMNCNKSEEQQIKNDFNGNSGIFQDPRDQKTYDWVRIGNQIWLANNLDFSLSNGTWHYNSNPDLSNAYGRLYTHEAALQAIPEGWHLPSLEEINILTEYLGGSSVAGGKMKQHGTSQWNLPNVGADNTSGFSALPGGMYDPGDGFYEKGKTAFFWTSSSRVEGSSPNIFYYYLESDDASINFDSTDPAVGFSVRCILD